MTPARRLPIALIACLGVPRAPGNRRPVNLNPR